jgi:hypothetical protein
MENIYLPIDNVNVFACYSVLDKDTIRAYRSQPQIDSSSEYVDFYINSHYLQKTGIQSWGQWNSSLPTCLSADSITTDYYYRNDFPDILLIFIIFAIVGIYLPFKLISRIFRKGVL